MIKILSLYLFSTIVKMEIVRLVSPQHVTTHCLFLYRQQHW